MTASYITITVPMTSLSQIEDAAGRWVKLSEDALKQFGCQGSAGYALSYSSERKEEFLEEKEVRTTATPPLNFTNAA